MNREYSADRIRTMSIRICIECGRRMPSGKISNICVDCLEAILTAPVTERQAELLQAEGD